MSTNNTYNLLSPQMQQHISNYLFFQAQQTNNQQGQNTSDLLPLANSSPTQQQQQQHKEIQLDQGFVTPQIQIKTNVLPKNKSVTSFTSTSNLKTIENMQNWMDFKQNGVNQNQDVNITQNGPLFSIPAENPQQMQMHLSKLALSGENNNQFMSSSFDNNFNSQCVLPSPLAPWDLCNLNSGNNNNIEFLGRLHMDPNKVSSIESNIEHNGSNRIFSNSYGSGMNLFQYDQLTFPQKQNSLPFVSDNNNNINNNQFQNTFINNNNNSCNSSGNKPLVSKFQSQSRENINMFSDLIYSPFPAAVQHSSPQSTQINLQISQQQQLQQPYLISPNINSQQNLLLAATQIINNNNNLNGIQNTNNGSFIIPQITNNINIQKQQCLIEEQEEDESNSKFNKCPLVKAEHVSEDEDSKSHKQQQLLDTPKPAQLLGQISATLIDRQARFQKKYDQQQGTNGKEMINLNSKTSRNNSQKIDQNKGILTNSIIPGDFGEDESDIEKAKKICEQQSQLLRSLGSQYQLQPIFQQAYNQQFDQSREFQQPVNPIQFKHMKYIHPLCQIYQNFLQNGNIQQNNNNNPRLRDIQSIILNTKLSKTFIDLPSNYNDIFQENLSFLIETIHKESLIRQNPHLLFGGKDTNNKQSTTTVIPSLLQPKLQQGFAVPSSSSLDFKQRIIPPISPNEAHSFSIRHTLKKIDSDFTTPNQSSNTPASFNSLNPCILSNTQLPRSGIEEDFSPDSFSEYRKRQLSAISLGPNMTGMHSPVISKQLSNGNSQLLINPQERTLLNLYGQFSGKDKERSRQFATAKNSPGTAQNPNTLSPKNNEDPSLLIMKRSKYHNLTKLFMYFLLSLFQADNMTRLGVPEHIQQELIKCIQNVKKTAKKKIKNKNLQKTDFFNHTHYNVLFLHLNKRSLKELQKKDKDILVHLQCFGLDLTNIDVQRLEYVNILKKFAFEIVINTLESPSESDCIKNPRNEYMLKALSGIRQLAQGNVIFRFQQVYNSNNSQKQDD